ncbi:MAG: hypothetical protein AAGJ69_11795, partial [Cyanobacteria bacterium J06559_1]
MSASVTGISFSPTEPILAAAYSDTFVRLWAINTDRSLSATGAPNAQPQTSPVMILKGHEDWARAVAFSPDGKTIVTGSEDQTVRLWNRQGKLLRVITGHQGWSAQWPLAPMVKPFFRQETPTRCAYGTQTVVKRRRCTVTKTGCALSPLAQMGSV